MDLTRSSSSAFRFSVGLEGSLLEKREELESDGREEAKRGGGRE